ncbi:MAG TPA: hypothetical protein ENG33_01735 [Chloroflexi bacterium]|nr:hypothetical protein [Chloroflexota bacterium]
MWLTGFLLDENVPAVLKHQLKRIKPSIKVLAVGDPDAPPKGTPDAELLCWIEEHNYILVTANRSSMPVHLKEHLAAQKHIPGILILPRILRIKVVLEDLVLIWEAGQPDDLRDQIIYLPL